MQCDGSSEPNTLAPKVGEAQLLPTCTKETGLCKGVKNGQDVVLTTHFINKSVLCSAEVYQFLHLIYTI